MCKSSRGVGGEWVPSTRREVDRAAMETAHLQCSLEQVDRGELLEHALIDPDHLDAARWAAGLNACGLG